MKNSEIKEKYIPIIEDIKEIERIALKEKETKKKKKENKKEIYDHSDMSKINMEEKLRLLIEENNDFIKDTLLSGVSPLVYNSIILQKKMQRKINARFLYIDFPKSLVSNSLFFEDGREHNGISLKKIFYIQKRYGMNKIPINYFINEILYKTMFPWIIQENTILLVRIGEVLSGMSLEYLNMPWWDMEDRHSSFSEYQGFLIEVFQFFIGREQTQNILPL